MVITQVQHPQDNMRQHVKSSHKWTGDVERGDRTNVFWNKCFAENQGNKITYSFTGGKGEGNS